MHNDIPTNYHFVLSYEAERTILVKHQEYPYALPEITEPPKTLYLSSLGDGTEDYHASIADYVEQHKDIFLAFQPGTFQMKLGAEKLARIYKRANLLFANKEEYQRILGSKSTDVEELLNEMKALGPDMPILTDGREGAYALTNDGIVHVPMFPDPAPPVERTGAGDAFSSTTAAYLTAGMDIKEAIEARHYKQRVCGTENRCTNRPFDQRRAGIKDLEVQAPHGQRSISFLAKQKFFREGL